MACRNGVPPLTNGVAPNLALSYVPTIQSPTKQVVATANGGCGCKRRDWFDYVLLGLAFIAVVHAMPRSR